MPKLICLLFLTLTGLFLFSMNISNFEDTYFDEKHYIPAARKILEFESIPNKEHPPLVKFIHASSIKVLGDNPFGWRMPGVLFGVALVLAIFLIAHLLFNSLWYATLTALLTLFNQILFVQARIATLDIFMTCMMFWSFFFALKSLRNQKDSFWCFGFFAGLAIACKWFALVPYLALLLVIWLCRFKRPKRIKLFLATIFLPSLIYLISFTPYFFFTNGIDNFSELLSLQLEMFQLQKSVGGSHPYQSEWWQWPLLNRPIWYSFVKLSENFRGVFCIGNPLLFVAGALAIVINFYYLYRERCIRSFWICFLYSTLFFSWALIPRKISFFYYYFPASLLLGFAIVNVLQKQNLPKWVGGLLYLATATVFIFFYPVLAGQSVPMEKYTQWIWPSTGLFKWY